MFRISPTLKLHLPIFIDVPYLCNIRITVDDRITVSYRNKSHITKIFLSKARTFIGYEFITTSRCWMAHEFLGFFF